MMERGCQQNDSLVSGNRHSSICSGVTNPSASDGSRRLVAAGVGCRTVRRAVWVTAGGSMSPVPAATSVSLMTLSPMMDARALGLLLASAGSVWSAVHGAVKHILEMGEPRTLSGGDGLLAIGLLASAGSVWSAVHGAVQHILEMGEPRTLPGGDGLLAIGLSIGLLSIVPSSTGSPSR